MTRALRLPVAFFAVATFELPAGTLRAADWPTRPVTVIVPLARVVTRTPWRGSPRNACPRNSLSGAAMRDF